MRVTVRDMSRKVNYLSKLTELTNYVEEYKHIDYFFKDKTNFIIKLQNVCIYRYVCCEMNSFFQHFHKYFPRIHRSVTYKITIDVSYF